MRKPKNLSVSLDVLEESKIPQKYWHLSVDTYEGDKDALSEVSKYLKHVEENFENGQGLFIRGPLHSHKTFLLTYALKVLLSKDYDCRYLKIRELVDLMMASKITQLSRIDYVALDNLDADVFNPAARMAVTHLINFRADEGKPTLFACSVDPGIYGRQLLNHIDKRLTKIDLGALDPAPEGAQTYLPLATNASEWEGRI
jgi:DNA replication protein DnaC